MIFTAASGLLDFNIKRRSIKFKKMNDVLEKFLLSSNISENSMLFCLTTEASSRDEPNKFTLNI